MREVSQPTDQTDDACLTLCMYLLLSVRRKSDLSLNRIRYILTRITNVQSISVMRTLHNARRLIRILCTLQSWFPLVNNREIQLTVFFSLRFRWKNYRRGNVKRRHVTPTSESELIWWLRQRAFDGDEPSELHSLSKAKTFFLSLPNEWISNGRRRINFPNNEAKEKSARRSSKKIAWTNICSDNRRRFL